MIIGLFDKQRYVKKAVFHIKKERYDKPGYVADDHLSSLYVTTQLQRPPESTAGNRIAFIKPCFERGLH